MGQFYKVVHRGTFASGEVFNHSHRIDTDAGVTLANVATAVAAGRAALFTTGFLGNYHNSVTWVDAAIYSVGLEDEITTEQTVVASAFQGTVTGSTILPTEVAMVLTLRSSIPTSRGRGRMYLPPPAVSFVDGSGLYNSTIRSAVVAGWKAYFEAVNSATIRVSIRGMEARPATTHHYQRIDTIDVGSVPDVQRRRRNRTAETRTSASITP